MPGVHVPGQVRRDLGGDKPQHRRPPRRHPESDPAEGQPEPSGRKRRRFRRHRALVQVARRRACQYEGPTDAHLAVRQGGPQVQELRESSCAVKTLDARVRVSIGDLFLLVTIDALGVFYVAYDVVVGKGKRVGRS